MLPSLSELQVESAPRKGKKKALLIAVGRVKDIQGSLPQANYDAQELKDFLIKEHDYAENDIVMLLHDCKVEKSLWPSRDNIINQIKLLVKDLGEHDKLVFYYSGHGGQTTCRHNSEVDGKDEAIYAYTGHKIIDNVLRRELVVPVLKKKGCQLFALFDCCHSETILDLKHGSCCFRRSLPLVKSSITSDRASGMEGRLSKEIPVALPVSASRQSKNDLPVSPPNHQSIAVIEYMNRTLRNFRNYISKMLAGLFDRKLSPIDKHVPTASVKGHLLIDTTPISQPDLFMSPNRIVMSPIQFQEGYRTCDITENEENEGHIVCLSACRDNQMASDDNETGGTLTKFFMSSLKKNGGISYKDLLNDIQSQVTNLQAKRAAQMQGQSLEVSRRRWRQPGILSELDFTAIRRGGCPQEPRISSNRPFDLNNTFSI